MKKSLIIVAIAAIFASCGNGTKKQTGTEKSSVSLAAAGATFPQPFYNLIFKNYSEKTGVTVDYGGVGSGGGIRSLKDQVIDFGATDAYLSDDQAKEMPAEVVHIPTCIGAVVIAYNLPEVAELKLTNANLEDIFMGDIKKWNDPKIAASNPGVKLPDLAVTVVYRSDGSGTTFIFSDYMTKIGKRWAEKIGTGKSLNWPAGIGAKGNPGVAGTIKQTVGAVGYIGSEYSFAQSIATAKLQNAAGNFIEPTIESISAAAKGEIPADTRIMITNSTDADAYPISGMTWIILYKEQAYKGRTKEQAEATLKLLDWVIDTDAQLVAPQVHYAPLPASTVEKAKAILRSVTYNGEIILK